MVRSIFVPLDGSSRSERALPFALDLADRFQAAIEVVHVHEPLPPLFGKRERSEGQRRNCMTRAESRSYLESLCNQIASVSGPPVTHALLHGNVADSLVREAATADLIVAAPRRRALTGRIRLGSVTDALIRRLSKPVILVPGDAQFADRSSSGLLRRIVVPLDGSELAEQILEPAIMMSTPSHTELTLLRVCPPMLPGYPPGGGFLDHPEVRQLRRLHGRDLEEARACLERQAARWRAMSFNVTTRVVTHRSPATAIHQAATALGADMIALATHGRSGLKRMLLGSVASKVVGTAAVPLLVYRPAADSNGWRKPASRVRRMWQAAPAAAGQPLVPA